jgi:hypothetical protein
MERYHPTSQLALASLPRDRDAISFYIEELH